MFPVLFLIPRAAGWLAHWTDQMRDPQNRMYRPDMVRAHAVGRCGSPASCAHSPTSLFASAPPPPLSLFVFFFGWVRGVYAHTAV